MINCLKKLSEEYKKILAKPHYNIYEYDYDMIQLMKIDVDLEFGKSLQKSNDPNPDIDRYINKHNAIPIYTDGSKLEESMSTGTACICDQHDIIITNSVPKCFSIYTAESVALLNAVEIAIKKPNANYIIFSDSLSSLSSSKKDNC